MFCFSDSELKLKLRESARIRGAGVESKSSSEVSNGGRGRLCRGRKNEKIHDILMHFLKLIPHMTYQMKEIEMLFVMINVEMNI